MFALRLGNRLSSGSLALIAGGPCAPTAPPPVVQTVVVPQAQTVVAPPNPSLCHRLLSFHRPLHRLLLGTGSTLPVPKRMSKPAAPVPVRSASSVAQTPSLPW